METDQRIPSGEWSGFYLENHQPKRGWMHLYLTFEDGQIKGEGTDYVGPWVASGSYDVSNGTCRWEKKYLNKHSVSYDGQISNNGIQGQWQISFITGPFHIWPRSLGHFNELYLSKEMDEPTPSLLLDTVPVNDFV